MDNLWISFARARSGRWETPVKSQTLKLPEVRHLLAGIQDASWTHRARRYFLRYKRSGFLRKSSKPGLTPSQDLCYTIDETAEREGKVPFFMLLIPLKLLLLLLVIQWLLA